VALHEPICDANFFAERYSAIFGSIFFDLLHANNISRNIHLHAQSSRYQHTYYTLIVMMSVFLLFLLQLTLYQLQTFFRLCFCNSGQLIFSVSTCCTNIFCTVSAIFFLREKSCLTACYTVSIFSATALREKSALQVGLCNATFIYPTCKGYTLKRSGFWSQCPRNGETKLSQKSIVRQLAQE